MVRSNLQIWLFNKSNHLTILQFNHYAALEYLIFQCFGMKPCMQVFEIEQWLNGISL